MFKAVMSREAAGSDAASGAGACAIPANMGALTSLRALLAWWVVVFHLAPLAPFYLNQDELVLHKGPVLVDCFFVLSGFVLFHVHPRILTGTADRQAAAKFLIARVARLYPTHLAVLAAFVLLIGGLRIGIGFRPSNPEAFSTIALIEQLLLLHGTVFPTYEAWNFPSWSISSECAAYLLAPLLFRQINQASGRALSIAGVTIAIAAASGVETGWLTRWPALLVLRVTLEFSLGALLRLLAGAAFIELYRHRRLGLTFGWVGVALFAPTRHPGLFLASMVWLMLFLSLTAGWGGWSGRICRYLGETSYGVYMCHAFVLTVWAGVQSRFDLGPFAAPVPAFLLLCGAVQGGACLLHHLVEIPGRRAVRGWSDRRYGGRAEIVPMRLPGPPEVGPLQVGPATGTCASVSPRISTT